MWLVNAHSHKLEYFLDTRNAPPYVILSHTWAEDEVNFESMDDLERARGLQGWKKIRFTCDQALHDGLEYAWVDTCCIDKKSSAELSEAINSMYQYYKAAEKCYVYLAELDVQGPVPRIAAERWLYKNNISERFRQCRWFGRGWTLQELLAPIDLEFRDSRWTCVGTLCDLADLVGQATGIDLEVLLHIKPPSSCSIACRMSWAAGRTTSRVEDVAYSLLGLFGVNMPLLYGEGTRAFKRLQAEIFKISPSMSVLAWVGASSSTYVGVGADDILAASPDDFAGCGEVELDLSGSFVEMASTTIGIRMTAPVIRSTDFNPDNESGGVQDWQAWRLYRYLLRHGEYSLARTVQNLEDSDSLLILNCTLRTQKGVVLAIPLRHRGNALGSDLYNVCQPSAHSRAPLPPGVPLYPAPSLTDESGQPLLVTQPATCLCEARLDRGHKLARFVLLLPRKLLSRTGPHSIHLITPVAELDRPEFRYSSRHIFFFRTHDSDGVRIVAAHPPDLWNFTVDTGVMLYRPTDDSATGKLYYNSELSNGHQQTVTVKFYLGTLILERPLDLRRVVVHLVCFVEDVGYRHFVHAHPVFRSSVSDWIRDWRQVETLHRDYEQEITTRYILQFKYASRREATVSFDGPEIRAGRYSIYTIRRQFHQGHLAVFTLSPETAISPPRASAMPPAPSLASRVGMSPPSLGNEEQRDRLLRLDEILQGSRSSGKERGDMPEPPHVQTSLTSQYLPAPGYMPHTDLMTPGYMAHTYLPTPGYMPYTPALEPPSIYETMGECWQDDVYP